MKPETLQFIELILSSDISKDAKEQILLYYLLPKPQTEANTYTSPPPIEKMDDSRVGAIKRPDKATLDLKNNPKLKEEVDAMSETLDDLGV